MEHLQKFRNEQIKRQKLHCPPDLGVWLDYCEYAIHAEFDKNSKSRYKEKKRKKEVDINFRNAIDNFNREEKVHYYLRAVQSLSQLNSGVVKPPLREMHDRPVDGECEARSFNLKIWKEKKIRIDQNRHEVMVEKDKKIKTYYLRDYLMRKSKLSDKNVFVLEAINSKPHEKSRTVHIAFKNAQMLTKWSNLVEQEVHFCEWLNVKEMYDRMTLKNPELQVVYQEPTTEKTAQNIGKSPTQSPQQQKEQKSQNEAQLIHKKGPEKQQDSKNEETHKISEQELKLEKIEEELEKEQQNLVGQRKTVIDHLVNDDCADFQELFDELENQAEVLTEEKKNLDFFHKLLPEFQIEEVKDLAGFESLKSQGSLQVFKHLQKVNRFKLVLKLDSTEHKPQSVISLISEPRHTKEFNKNIYDQEIKTMIQSENSAIMYQTLNAYNKFYRLRDFIYVRHVFVHRGNIYMVDRSIDNINYPPFLTYVRGEVSAVWGIFQHSGTIEVYADVNMSNLGMLSVEQDARLTLNYLSGFGGIFNYEAPSENYEMFKLDWNIDEKPQNQKNDQIRVRRRTLQVQKQLLSQKLQKPSKPSEESKAKQQMQSSKISEKKEIQESSEEDKRPSEAQTQPISAESKASEKQPSPITQQTKREPIQVPSNTEKKPEPVALKTVPSIVRNFQHEGYVVIDNSYAKQHQVLAPVQKSEEVAVKKVKGHSIWKGDWSHDDKSGGMLFVNQKKMEDQRGVLKFVLTKIGKNILSGKSILNISLPVDIFLAESNLERLLISMSYGPKMLQNLEKASQLERLKKVVCFGLSNSVLYINMEKPFNPILGETFQCWINGCPAYAEQISHHPPIGSLLFLGRGYKVTSQLESKVELHMNSGCGSNEGIYRVTFDDGTEVCFTTPGGEVSGLTYGDRKFNLVGKSYYWIESQKIFLEITFDAGKKGFFSKQEQPVDYFEGKVFEVTKEFFATFLKSKKREVNEKQKIKEIGRFEGIWNKYIKFDGQQVFSFDKVPPIQLEYESKPLPSDSNWRQDIEYRRINKVTRAQTEKERLEVLQRKDRKLRAQYQKKKK